MSFLDQNMMNYKLFFFQDWTTSNEFKGEASSSQQSIPIIWQKMLAVIV